LFGCRGPAGLPDMKNAIDHLHQVAALRQDAADDGKDLRTRDRNLCGEAGRTYQLLEQEVVYPEKATEHLPHHIVERVLLEIQGQLAVEIHLRPTAKLSDQLQFRSF